MYKEEYWYGEDEEPARKWDIEYVKEKFANVTFRGNSGQDHAEFFTLHPEDFCIALKGAVNWQSK